MPVAPLDSYAQSGEALKASKRETDARMTLPTGYDQSRSQEEDLVDRPQVDAG